MSLAIPPESNALGNSKGGMSQDLDASLHYHGNYCGSDRGGIFPPEGKFSEDRSRLEKTQKEKSLKCYEYDLACRAQHFEKEIHFVKTERFLNINSNLERWLSKS
jgi:hypothetical protein